MLGKLIISAFILTINVSTQCFGSEITPYDSFKNLKEIAAKIQEYAGNQIEPITILKMLDASTKIPSGFLAGNFFDLGNFDECYNIRDGDISGKYCLGMPSTNVVQIRGFETNLTQRKLPSPIHPEPMLAGLGQDFAGFHFAACVPNTLPASNIPHGSFWKFREDFCYSKATAPAISPWAVFTIVFISIFLGIAVASTIYDIFLLYTKQSAGNELLIAFSFLSNGRKIFKSSTNPDQLLCLNGIKAISMMWVILGHVYYCALNSPILNFNDIVKWQDDVWNMLINGATVSVDTFFTVGGLVTVYTYLKSQDKGVKFNVILFYIHRYLRLTPALGVAALVYANLLGLLATGPVWNVVDLVLAQSCKDQWWSTILYVANFVQKGFCVPQSWYLSVDMQLFVLSPIVLITLSKWPKPGLGLLAALAILGVVSPFTIGYVNKLGPMSDHNYMNLYYTQTYARFGPYVLGMLLGYFIYDVKKSGLKYRLSPAVVSLLWSLGLIGLVACVFAGKDVQVSGKEPLTTAFYLGFNRNAWSLSLGLVIFLCVAGYGGPVDGFLSLPVFQFITKISYSMYLVHFGLIIVRYSALKNTFKFSNIVMMHYFWGDFMFTLAISLLLCLLFESPVIILEKYLFGGFSKPSKKTTI